MRLRPGLARNVAQPHSARGNVPPTSPRRPAGDPAAGEPAARLARPPPRHGRRHGREYLAVKLDDPTFAAPIFASLVAVEGGDGSVLIWSRRTGD